MQIRLSLKKTSLFFSFCSKWWQNDKVSCLRLFQDSKSIHGFNLIQLLLNGSNETRRYLGDIMHKVFILFKEGKIKPVVDSVFAFEDVKYTCLEIFILK